MAATRPQHPSSGERVERGREARRRTPRSSHAAWEPAADRPDPVDLLVEQAATRVLELVPLRYGRMLTSPFAFYRGAAYVMASDLSATPTSDISVQLCGDAHLSNFGGFAAPDRRLVFDMNDFDETLPGPWEWDVKRLAASVAVAGREMSLSEKARRRAVVATVRGYRETMRTLASMRNLDVWYVRVEADELISEVANRVSSSEASRVKGRLARARNKDSLRALKRLSENVNGRPRIVNDPPLVVPVRELLRSHDEDVLTDAMRAIYRRYAGSLRPDVRHMLDSYELHDIARKVVGVGSVGTRAWILLFTGRDGRDPLFLQAKEAQTSVLEPFLSRTPFRNHGRRVVEGQRLLQPASDVMLGWTRAGELENTERDYYIRQLWDWKLSAEIESMTPAGLRLYGQLCGATLARGHARSGDRIAIASYLGSGRRFDDALADFAEAYADQNERDYSALAEAVKSGRIEAQTGV